MTRDHTGRGREAGRGQIGAPAANRGENVGMMRAVTALPSIDLDPGGDGRQSGSVGQTSRRAATKDSFSATVL